MISNKKLNEPTPKSARSALKFKQQNNHHQQNSPFTSKIVKKPNIEERKK